MGRGEQRGFKLWLSHFDTRKQSFHVPRPEQIELQPDNTHWLKVGQVYIHVILCCGSTEDRVLSALIYSWTQQLCDALNHNWDKRSQLQPVFMFECVKSQQFLESLWAFLRGEEHILHQMSLNLKLIHPLAARKAISRLVVLSYCLWYEMALICPSALNSFDQCFTWPLYF